MCVEERSERHAVVTGWRNGGGTELTTGIPENFHPFTAAENVNDATCNPAACNRRRSHPHWECDEEFHSAISLGRVLINPGLAECPLLG
jgi:hypothetical protein